MNSTYNDEVLRKNLEGCMDEGKEQPVATLGQRNGAVVEGVPVRWHSRCDRPCCVTDEDVSSPPCSRARLPGVLRQLMRMCEWR